MKWLFEKMLILFNMDENRWWKKYVEYRYSISVAIFVVFLALIAGGVIALGFLIVWLFMWLCANHLEIVIFFSVVIFVCACIINWKINQAKIAKAEQEEKQRRMEMQKKVEIDNKAKRDYYSVRSKIFGTLAKCAKHIECDEIQTPKDIDMTMDKYEIKDSIIFYMFRLPKADMKKIYDDVELESLAEIIRRVLARKLHEGDDEDFETEDKTDEYGNKFEKLNIDRLEDWGDYFVVFVVVYSEAYAKYWRNKRLNSSEDCVREHNDKDF